LKAAGALGTAAFVASPNRLFGLLGPVSATPSASEREVIAHAIDGQRISSVAALETAWRSRADGADVDVRCSSDGVLYVWHDATLLSHASRTLGSIESLPASRLDDLGVLRLDDAQAACPPGRFLIWDVKDSRVGAIAALTQQIERSGSNGNRMWLGSADAVHEVAQRFPLLEVGLLRDTRDAATTRQYVLQAANCGARSVSIHPAGLTASGVQYAHRHDLRVYCYARGQEQYQAAVGAGVDALVADYVPRAQPSPTEP
jgi:glycerophosphoryl diester phosphodiesterase